MYTTRLIIDAHNIMLGSFFNYKSGFNEGHKRTEGISLLDWIKYEKFIYILHRVCVFSMYVRRYW